LIPMKTPKEWATECLKTTFRWDFESLVQRIQEDALTEYKNSVTVSPMKIYMTSYCNKGHDLETGKPVNHDCYVLPVDALKAEMDGDTGRSINILSAQTVRKIVKGIKA
jgi:hypothetical protein